MEMVKDGKNLEIGKDKGDSLKFEGIRDLDEHKESLFPKIDELNTLIGPEDVFRELGGLSTLSMENLVGAMQNFTKWTSNDVYKSLEFMAMNPTSSHD